MDAFFAPASPLTGEARAPADKSISHRAALLGAMAADPVRVENYLDAADTASTLAAVEALGTLVERDGSDLVLRGTGIRDAREPAGTVDVGNAGTLLRLLPGWLAAQSGRSFTLDGDESIRRRPVGRIMAPLTAMGAELRARGDGYTPLTVRGAQLRAIDWQIEVASAQVKSCVLFAGLAADGTTSVTEPTVSRDHTERMLRAAGVAVSRAATTVTVVSADDVALGDVRVPGDVSSAAFLVAAGVLVPRSRLLIRDVGVNWTRTGFLRIVRRMRGIVFGELEEPREEIAAHEPVSDLDVAHGALEGTTVRADEVPAAIDELPLVALLGCFAEGETVVEGAQELRIKETDRISAVVDGLRGLGGDIEATADGFVVRGSGGLRGGTLDSRGDHRLAMLGAVAGLASREGVRVIGMESAAVSYPTFARDLAALC
ncbi:MAG TPA: 3-phosphoshikimate 1-carboxyvinyltransferase [Solirubrobacteraceae bacterium]|nr:3-phosphoshikimate 1-carboxyvinyltransferase [Solirubrobacteraceae bacterium]